MYRAGIKQLNRPSARISPGPRAKLTSEPPRSNFQRDSRLPAVRAQPPPAPECVLIGLSKQPLAGNRGKTRRLFRIREAPRARRYVRRVAFFEARRARGWLCLRGLRGCCWVFNRGWVAQLRRCRRAEFFIGTRASLRADYCLAVSTFHSGPGEIRSVGGEARSGFRKSL